MAKVQIDEAEHARLVESAGTVDELTEKLTEAETKLAEAEAKLPAPSTPGKARTTQQQISERLDAQKHEIDVMKARESARDVINAELSEAWLANSTVARLSTELLADLPLKEDGTLDITVLRDHCVEARDRAELEAAETLDAAGFGRPTGLGASTPPVGGDTDKYAARVTENLGNAFGLSEAESKTAVKGR